MATPKQVLDLLGIEYIERPNRYAFCCPFHDDTDPSAGFYEDTEYYHCYACDFHYNTTKFYAEFQGVSYQDAEKDLEKRFGEHHQRNTRGDATKNEIARLRVQRVLKAVRPQLDMQTFAHLGELGDRIVLLHERKARNDLELDTGLDLWYNCVEEATNGSHDSHPGSAPTDSLDGWLQEGMAELSGPGGQSGEVDLD